MSARVDMGDMGGHHLGREPGAGLAFGDLSLGFLQRGNRRLQLAVRGGQLFGMGQQLIAQRV